MPDFPMPKPRSDASPLHDERIIHPKSLFRAEQRLDRPLSPPRPGVGATLLPGVTRWLPEGVTPDDPPIPSFALEDPGLGRETGAPISDPTTVVHFGACLDARHLIEVPIEAGTTLHGVGMHAAPLERSGRVYTCWNTDWPAYTDSNPSLYQSHPWVFAVRVDGSAFGVLADTTFRCDVDLTDPAAIRVRAEGPAFPVYILEAESPLELCRLLARVTGRPPMLPLWALGYHQCRWSYYPAGRAMRIAEEFRTRQIPCDVIWFDIHYMQDYRIFTFHEHRFPDPRSVNDRLHEMGFRTVWMIDPAPKKDDDDPVYATGTEGGHFTLASDGEPYVGSVWAGPSCFPDFTRPETRKWWAGLYKDYLAHGIDGVWNDMNEPSVFDDITKTMPENTWHRGGDGLPAAPHAAYHNVYGMLMVRASREGILAARPDKRPFLLTRSNFLGGHRYAATWTGDNAATWTDLHRSIPMVLSLGLSGQPMSGPDIGGFIDPTEGDPELFARWMGVGCLLPFARAHVADGCIDKEPWSFGPECEATCRRAIELRYRLMPHLYTLAWRAHTQGDPITLPAFFADASDADLRTEDRAFLLGEHLLVTCDVYPKNDAEQRTPIATPKSDWRPVQLGEPDPDLPELHLKAGAAIPTGPVMLHTGEKPVDPLTIVAALDDSGRAEGLLYEDAGDGWSYQTGDYCLSRIRVECVAGAEPKARLEHVEGDRPAVQRSINIVLV
jgi:alpha-glucosidase